MICAVLRWCYTALVGNGGSAPPGSDQEKNQELKKVCVMSLANVFRRIDRILPVYLLFLGLFAAGATAGLGVI
jgi:hypothetical protein